MEKWCFKRENSFLTLQSHDADNEQKLAKRHTISQTETFSLINKATQIITCELNLNKPGRVALQVRARQGSKIRRSETSPKWFVSASYAICNDYIKDPIVNCRLHTYFCLCPKAKDLVIIWIFWIFAWSTTVLPLFFYYYFLPTYVSLPT